ncbi:MAG: hypothetical protein ACFFCS_14795 [Candidatus Hodarchaeota archaeon]
MGLIDLIKANNFEDLSIYLRCLLDRIPIVVCGSQRTLVNDIISESCDLVHFRKKQVLGLDFHMKNKYLRFLREEILNSSKGIYCAPVEQTDILLKRFDDLTGWIVGILSTSEETINERLNEIRMRNPRLLVIEMNGGYNIDSSMLFGKRNAGLSVQFEKKTLKKALSRIGLVERANRILSRKVKDETLVDERFFYELTDLSIFLNLKKEMTDFYQAATRCMTFLSKLNYLYQYRSVKIGKKMLLEAILYDIDIKRFMDFIWEEWGKDFSHLVEENKFSALGDQMDSLWG